MKKNPLCTLKFIIPLFSALLLCGAFLDRAKGPALPSKKTLSEKEAVWSRFIGYGPEAYATKFSTFNQSGALIIAQQARKLLGIQTDTGQAHWHKHISGHTFTNLACANRTKVFIGTDEPRLFALDSNTGDLIWSTSLPETTLARVAADQQQVFVKTTKGNLIALDEQTGKILWQYKHPTALTTLRISSAPVLSEDKVIVGFPDGQLLALDRTTGELIWKHTVAVTKPGSSFDTLVDIAADPVIDNKNDTIYVSTYQGKLKSLSLTHGDTKWERSFSGYMPLILGDQLVSIDSDDIVYAFDKNNGNICWSQPVFKEYKKIKADYQIIGPVSISDNMQLVIADYIGNLYWLALSDGSIVGKASFTITSPIVTLPLALEDKVYAINRRSQMAAWDLTKYDLLLKDSKESFVF